jgi:flagellar motor switch protein FliG
MKKGDVTLAATLFVLIGEETASEVLRYLNEAEIEAISREISNVGPLQHTDAEKSAEEL